MSKRQRTGDDGSSFKARSGARPPFDRSMAAFGKARFFNPPKSYGYRFIKSSAAGQAKYGSSYASANAAQQLSRKADRYYGRGAYSVGKSLLKRVKVSSAPSIPGEQAIAPIARGAKQSLKTPVAPVKLFADSTDPMYWAQEIGASIIGRPKRDGTTLLSSHPSIKLRQGQAPWNFDYYKTHPKEFQKRLGFVSNKSDKAKLQWAWDVVTTGSPKGPWQHYLPPSMSKKEVEAYLLPTKHHTEAFRRGAMTKGAAKRSFANIGSSAQFQSGLSDLMQNIKGRGAYKSGTNIRSSLHFHA